MCINTSPQPRSPASSSIAGSAAPLMSLIATAPAVSARSATWVEKVSAEIGTSAASTSPSIAGTSLAASSSGGTGGPRRAATAPTSSISKPRSARPRPSCTAPSGVPLRAPSKNESSVTLTIPTAIGRPNWRVRSLSFHRGAMNSGYGSPMPLRCVYTDLDGTLLGRDGSLFHDAEGNFSLLQGRALEACDRAGVEVVIKSGRGESSVMEDAKLIGSRSYICEVGAVV